MKYIEINKKYIRRMIASFGLSAVTLLTMGCNATSINNKEPESNKNLTSEQFLNEFDQVYNNNVEVVQEWEEIYPAIRKYISNYGEYLDQQSIINKLDSLEFVVEDKLENDVTARTDFENNKIRYSKRFTAMKEEDKKGVVLHEAIHFLLQECFYKSNSNGTGWALDEGNAQILVTELSDLNDLGSYDKNTFYVKIMCELLGSDTYQRITAEHDYDELIETLANYSNNNKAKELLNQIDKACSYYFVYDAPEDRKACEIIEEMYKNKNGISIEEDNNLIIKVYLKKVSNINHKIPGANYTSDAQVVKNYFVDKDKQAVINCVNGGKIYNTLYLNEKGEVIDKISEKSNTKKV